jgi:hypothetical protein
MNFASTDSIIVHDGVKAIYYAGSCHRTELFSNGFSVSGWLLLNLDAFAMVGID